MPKKPIKPYPEFPLTPHVRGMWCCKIQGKTHYFSNANGPDAALAEYNRALPYIKAGVDVPASETIGLTVEDAANQFLDYKEEEAENGRLTYISYRDYRRTCQKFADHFGKSRLIETVTRIEFAQFRTAIGKHASPITLGNDIQRIRRTPTRRSILNCKMRHKARGLTLAQQDFLSELPDYSQMDQISPLRCCRNTAKI